MSTINSAGGLRIIAGCILLSTGVLGPFYEAPFRGEVALFDAARPVGFVFLGLAAAALVTGVTQRAWRAWLCGFAGLALSLCCLIFFLTEVGNIRSSFDRIMIGGLGRALTSHIELAWGFWALAGGSLMIVLGATAMLRSRNLANNYGSSYSTLR